MIHWYWLLPALAAGFMFGVEACLRVERRRRAFFDLLNQHTNVTYGPAPTLPPTVSYPQCSYPECKADTESSWDDMCIDHSLYQDSGRP